MEIYFAIIIAILPWCLYASGKEISQTLVISFDGLSAQYFDEFLKQNPKSNFQTLINDGLRADYMQPSFPTSTFPNHYTLVTGENKA